jgi:Protein of unknown function (DUF2851).
MRAASDESREGVAAGGNVAELQGLYGPFTFPEKLLQKIWLRRDFASEGAATMDGTRVRVIHPGKWNLLGGPDFRGARLRFGDGAERVGDVELHLHAGDWAAHDHARDAAYDGVVLHVVLFPPPAQHVTRGAGGREIPVLALLPLLLHDLEEYATEEAVEVLANRPAAQITEKLAPLPAEELEALIGRYAEGRWRQKVHFARMRVQRLGWEAACHHAALEILGYRFNRAPMLRVAGAFPLAEWRAAGFAVEAVFEAEREGWSLQGLRPANHPRRRLSQYAAWVRARPEWPGALKELAGRLPRWEPGQAVGEVRRRHRLTRVREECVERVCAGNVGGTRFENLVCDGFLPLLAANGEEGLGELWRAWFVGDLPAILPRALRELGVFDGRSRPASHGAVQGLLGWLLEQERNVADSSGRGA